MKTISTDRLWAPEKWVRARYDISRAELQRWRAEGAIKVRKASRVKVSYHLPSIERLLERMSA